MNNKRPFTEPALGEPVDLTARDANFPLMPLMGGGSGGPADGLFPGSGADGGQDSGGDGETPGNGGGDGV